MKTVKYSDDNLLKASKKDWTELRDRAERITGDEIDHSGAPATKDFSGFIKMERPCLIQVYSVMP
jgi:hypothetical protein